MNSWLLVPSLGLIAILSLGLFIPEWPRWWPLGVLGTLFALGGRIWLGVTPDIPPWARGTASVAIAVWLGIIVTWFVIDTSESRRERRYLAGRAAARAEERSRRMEDIR